MNILVTGANGQLGNELKVIHKERKNKSMNFIFADRKELDITNMDALYQYLAEHDIDIIVNCAAYTNVDNAEEDVKNATLVNEVASYNLARVCMIHNTKLIHISTDYVFGGNKCIPYKVDDNKKPLGVYGSTKADGEKSIKESGCEYGIIRTAWLYSEFGNNFVKTMMHLTKEMDEISVVYDQVGSPTYAYDLASFIYDIIEQDKFKESFECHYTNEGVCSWYDFAHKINELCNNGCNVKPCLSSEYKTKAKRPHYSVLDKSFTKEKFNVEIPYWEDSLKKCIDKLCLV